MQTVLKFSYERKNRQLSQFSKPTNDFYELSDPPWKEDLFKFRKGPDKPRNTWFFRGYEHNAPTLLQLMWKSLGFRPLSSSEENDSSAKEAGSGGNSDRCHDEDSSDSA